MSQNDLSIANQGFASFRSDLNSALQALGSTNSGTSAPSTTYANQLFYDTTNNILKIRNEDNDAFISLFTLDQTNDNIESLTINGAFACEGFTSNGIDDNADATAITIDNNKNIAIGVTSKNSSNNGSLTIGHTGMTKVSASASGNADELVLIGADASANVGMSIIANNANQSNIFFGDEDDTDIGGITYDHTGNSMRFTVNASERFRINNTGSAMFGTTTGSAGLTVETSKTANWAGRFENTLNTGFGGLFVTAGASSSETAFEVRKNTSDTALKILGDGNVGIGTSSPSTSLDVVRAGVQPLRIESSNGTEVAINMVNTGGNVQLEAHSGNFSIDADAVGIGTTSPSQLLDVVGGSANIRVAESSGGDLRMNVSGSTGAIGTHSNHPLLFRTNNSERMRIFSDGTVSVGSSSSTGGDQVKFHKVGNSGFLLNLNNAGQSSQNLISSQSGTAEMVHCQFNNSNGNVGTIKTSGSSTVYNTSSDYRLKENVVEIKDATAKLKQLKAYRFNFIADADTTLDGFLAHEVQTIVPEAVSGEKDAVDPDGNIDPQGIDQSKLVPLLVKTIQELEARITALEGA